VRNEAAKFGVGPGVSAGTPDPGMKILQALSDATGGRVFTVSPTLSLREIFAQIGQDLRLQYALGYTPPADIQPNSYHKLELKAKNNKLTVQARKGFFAAP
jgi:VWFA-related protein